MQRNSKVAEQTATGQGPERNPVEKKVLIKKRSKVPGVIISQYVEQIPEGKSTPDFTRKPMALTLQEGKPAVFKAVIIGDPTPKVTWVRSKGDISDPEKYQSKYDEVLEEYILEIPNVTAEQADTYKCFATNEFGKAVCTATLNVIEVRLKKKTASDATDFRKMLKKRAVRTKAPPKKEGEVDPAFWEVLMSADKKDYERICAEYGFTDFRWMLKKLNAMKKERLEEQKKYVERISDTKPIEVKGDGSAKFELNMQLKDPSSNIYLFKDGEMIDYGKDGSMKHNMAKEGQKYVFSIKDLGPEDAGLYQVDVEDTNVFSTDFKIPPVEFLTKIQAVEALEGEDAVFECVVSHPMPKVIWMAKNTPLEDGEKYKVTVSEDQLIHKLVIKGCKKEDKGIYQVIAGIQSSEASLVVGDRDLSNKNKDGKKSGGSGIDLEKIARDQRAKLQKERDEMEAAERARAEKEAADAAGIGTGGDGKGGSGRDSSAAGGTEGGGQGIGEGGGGSGGNGSGGAGSGDAGLGGDGSAEGGADKGGKRTRTGPLVPDSIIDPGIHFASGLSDVNAHLGESAELVCKLSSENCTGVWYKDGKKLTSTDGLTIVKEGAVHRLIIKNCTEADAGKYRFEAEGRKTEAILNVQDPPRFNPDDLSKFSEPIIVRAGENATFKMPFVGREPMKIQWYREGEELLDGTNVKLEKNPTQSRLLLSKCQRKDTGEIKIKIKNEFGTIEAFSKLIVIDKPTPPLGPVDIIESSANCIEMKWRPPKDDGGSPLTNYILERQQLGRNAWKKLGEIPGNSPIYRDTDVDHGRKYCYHIWAKNAEGVSEILETDDIMAGTKAFPSSPAAPKVVSAFKDCINLAWTPPTKTGGSNILGYNLEKRKKGSNLWSPVNPAEEPIQDKKYAVLDLVEGTEYEFRVTAINVSGPGEPSAPSDPIMARDPKKSPGKVINLKVTDSSYTTLSLAWNKPSEEVGVQDEAKGYFVEIRPVESLEWIRCNVNPITTTTYTVKGLKSMAMYWVRVVATNEGGEGEPQELDNYILAMPPPVRPNFKDAKVKSFMVVREGNSVRVNVNFQASPFPEITWLKDGMPVSKRVTISNSEGLSQLLITSSKRSDTGIYTITVKNLVGQESLSVEIRVTDDPKPPGPVELQQNVPSTVTLSWTSSPDEKLDDRLHYMVSKRDSVKRTWHTVADRLFNNNFTAINIMPGREYHFRVYAKNDMGLSEPSKSPTWGTKMKRDKFTISTPEWNACSFQAPPTFLVSLKTHTAPQGYECYMSCAVRGNPAPHVTWYRNNVSLNTDTNYYITNTCGVCSMLILRVGPKDNGEYKVMAENPLGRAECSTTLTVRE